MRHQKENPLAGAIRAKGKVQSTQTECINDASLGTNKTSELRIQNLRTAMDVAAEKGNVEAYKRHHDDYIKALKSRSHKLIQRLNEQHLAAVERVASLGDLETYIGRGAAWSTSRPVSGKADARGAA